VHVPIQLFSKSTQMLAEFLCSNAGGGINAYDSSDYSMPSQGYCDGTGGCNYAALESQSCDLAEGTIGQEELQQASV